MKLTDSQVENLFLKPLRAMAKKADKERGESPGEHPETLEGYKAAFGRLGVVKTDEEWERSFAEYMREKDAAEESG